MRKLLYPIYLILLFNQLSFAQIDMRIGQWKSYLPYHVGYHVTQSDDRVYYAAEWGILSLDKVDKSVEYLSTIDGMSEVGVDRLAYNQENEMLIIAYKSSIIDLRNKDGSITTITDIPRFTNLSGDKRIYDIHITSASTAYLATGYGLSLLDLDKAEIQATTFTGTKVNGVHIFNNKIYIATDQGVYFANNDGSTNLDDFGQWDFLDENDFPVEYSSNAIASFDNKLYMDIGNTLYSLDNTGSIDSIHNQDSVAINFISSGPNLLSVGYSAPGTRKIAYINKEGTIKTSSACMYNPRYAVEDQYGVVWVADYSADYIRYYENPINGWCSQLTFNTPASQRSNKILTTDEELWIATGGMEPNHNYNNYPDGLFSYIDGEWNQFRVGNTPTFDVLLRKNDIFDVEIHPETNDVYFSSFLEGLLVYDRENFTVYDEFNSTLGGAIGDESRSRVSGIEFDEDLNLWMCNHMASKPIAVLKNDGSWKSFDAPQSRFIDVVVDQNGYKWFITGETGIVLFDEGDLEIDGDERTRLINISNSVLESNKVKCIVVDLEGDVWVGTNEGAYIFECGANAFDDTCEGIRRIVEFDGYNAYLLETEDVRTIAVDGGNRKWFGTTNGVFVQSPNGEQEIASFNSSNSPLFDNTIIDIAINDESGEVFIGTDKGIISYRGQAIKGGRINSPTNVYAFPNPVQPNYDGPIAIKGLARDANVKITDVSGQLVYEERALGGQFIWNGKDYNGRKAASGVYLVFATNTQNQNNPDAVVTKNIIPKLNNTPFSNS